MIPRIIHFIWFGRPLPEWAKANMDQFRALNPNYVVNLHDESILLPEYAQTYRRIADVCSKSDLLALSALKRWGGWYLDCDFWPFRSMDGIVDAYALDQNRMFVTEQHGHLSGPTLPIANAVMAATPEWPGWPLIDKAVIESALDGGRCEFGPILLSRLVKQKPELFEVGAWPWFYPAEIGRAMRLYEPMTRGGRRYAKRIAPTNGQLPFMLHLWCAGGDVKPPRDNNIFGTIPPADGPYLGKRAVMACIREQWQDRTQPFQGVARGLASVGFEVEARDVTQPAVLDTADLVVLWNGRKGHYRDVAAIARTFNIPCLFMEHGFWDRRTYVQIDHAGILHWASWANGPLRTPAPPQGIERLVRFWPRPIGPFAPRGTIRPGYILVLGQLDGDSQMDDSELKGTLVLEKEITRHTRSEAYLRPHPLAQRGQRRQQYMAVCPAETLEAAVAGATFAVTINSNSGNEALAFGCPVLALGPSLYGAAGVALQTKLGDLPAALQVMQKGWQPDPAAVTNYLQWLACRQFNEAELATPEVMGPIVAAALSNAGVQQ